MKEDKVIPTQTLISSIGSDISIYTFFTAAVATIVAFISNLRTTIGEIFFKEGELGITQSGYEDLKFFIDTNGNLIIQSNSDKTFYLNSNGELIMEEPS